MFDMQTSDFDFDLPPELIAQHPAPRRDESRLLVLERRTGAIAHRQFPALLDYLLPGDVLVLNNSRVIPARLRGRNPAGGGRYEMLLLEEMAENRWWAMLRPGKRARHGSRIEIIDKLQRPSGIEARVEEINGAGHRLLRFTGAANILEELPRLGEVPLPPYIRRPKEDPADPGRYQTVYASPPGSVAAPTAGLHFTEPLLERIRGRGIDLQFVTLHAGPGTFAPVKTENLEGHVMHEERYSISPETIARLEQAKAAGRRIVAVGTTTVRVLESFIRTGARNGRTSIFIHPPFDFRMVDVLLTNFHLPRSTLLMLASAFAQPNGAAGRDLVLKAYREAVGQKYRFFSYGDAMLIR